MCVEPQEKNLVAGALRGCQKPHVPRPPRSLHPAFAARQGHSKDFTTVRPTFSCLSLPGLAIGNS